MRIRTLMTSAEAQFEKTIFPFTAELTTILEGQGKMVDQCALLKKDAVYLQGQLQRLQVRISSKQQSDAAKKSLSCPGDVQTNKKLHDSGLPAIPITDVLQDKVTQFLVQMNASVDTIDQEGEHQILFSPPHHWTWDPQNVSYEELTALLMQINKIMDQMDQMLQKITSIRDTTFSDQNNLQTYMTTISSTEFTLRRLILRAL